MNQEIVNVLIGGIITIISALVGLCVVYINSLKKRIEKGEKDYLNQTKKFEELESKNLSLEREFFTFKKSRSK